MKKRIRMTALLLAAFSVFAGCGDSDGARISFQEGVAHSVSADTAAVQKKDTYTDMEEDTREVRDDLCMVLANDVQQCQITLVDLSNGRQIQYDYTEGTEFFDKYGNYTPESDFVPGSLAVVQRVNSNNTLGTLAFTDRTWVYRGVRNYSIDTDNHRICIADTAYSYDNDIRVFSEGQESSLFDVGSSDELTVYGIDRQIYSIVVEKGHGTLVLTNTELFEGGWLNLGTKVYAEITAGMRMDIPEGIYTFSVANDGYGDSGEVRIRRGKTTTINLNDYKGEGPKMCKLTFDVGVDDAVLAINGKKIDYSKSLDLKYGIYELTVIAEGYDVWSKQLVVNSPSAAIDIALGSGGSSDNAGETDKQEDEQEEGSGSSQGSSSANRGQAGTLAGSLAGSTHAGGSSSSGTGTGSSKNSESSALADAALNSSLASIVTGGDSTDYLDTLADLVDSLDSLSKLSSRDRDD